MVLNLGLPNGFGGSNKITYCGSQEVALSDENHLMALNTGDKNSNALYYKRYTVFIHINRSSYLSNMGRLYAAVNIELRLSDNLLVKHI